MASENSEHRRAPGASPSAQHALVIEDFPVIAMSIQDELADLGYSVTIAATEAEAVALAHDRCPDLIIADLMLTQGSGIDAVRRVCRDQRIPVIFMSGDSEAIDIGATGEAGLLSKPFTSTALRSSIDAARPMGTT